MDLQDLASVRAAMDTAHHAFGRIDVLVNNVGIGPGNLAENVTEEDFDYTVDVNLKGTFFTAQAVAKLMMAQKSGRIINMSSQAGSVVLKGEPIYCMSKAAINHLTRCLAVDGRPTASPSTASRRPSSGPTAPGRALPIPFPRAVLEHIPLGRIGDPVDVAGTVVFLASRRLADHRREHPRRWRLVRRVRTCDVYTLVGTSRSPFERRRG